MREISDTFAGNNPAEHDLDEARLTVTKPPQGFICMNIKGESYTYIVEFLLNLILIQDGIPFALWSPRIEERRASSLICGLSTIAKDRDS